MKVLFVNRDPNLWIGGDNIQLQNTRKALEKQGIITDFTCNPNINFNKYDIIHIFHLNFDWAIKAAYNCQKINKPYIISAIFYPQQNDLYLDIINKSHKVIALCLNEKQEIIYYTKCNPDKIIIIPNGVDKNIFKFNGDFNLDKRKYVVNIGRALTTKGVHYLANACYKLHIPFIFINTYSGSYEEKQYLESFKNKVYKIYENIPQEEIAYIFQSCRIYVCPSLSERQSLGVLEAAACGLPIIDSIYNRGADLLPSSKIIDPKNIEQLTETLFDMYYDKNLQPNIDYVPSWDDVANQIINIYKEIIK